MAEHYTICSFLPYWQSLEDFKQEFEERLVERAGEVSHTLNRIQQLVTELEELSQVAHVNKYIRVRLSW